MILLQVTKIMNLSNQLTNAVILQKQKQAGRRTSLILNTNNKIHKHEMTTPLDAEVLHRNNN